MNNRFISLFAIMTILQGCSTIVPMDEKPDDPNFAPVPAQSLKPPAENNGSIYQANYSMALYGDQRSRRIGDIVTIILQEQTNASKSNSASTTKDSEIDVVPTSIFGQGLDFLQNDFEAERAFDGSGDADQSNSLQGQITVTISDILPNGVLEIRGEKWLSLNQGDEFIRVKGLIRPQDISSDNTVLSHKLADARISYGGTGYVHNASKPGWLDRFFTSQWWPF
ncbi:flagellar basal body L-ring protein FlgH [Bermanella marisrubri]|uniref:Flagellar L-ring protein n=1 Tax=Bermanella marisrubri TaxID=207949 RepID=Q1N2Z9_9GAMM|nr:flagellar basal body L-ring protein FlgH [Bermanella marisrubri]EAT12520.1 Flagellar basal body L-ring protein [Oceanobacter sp. RED65] [Bermanella marisrubri]QIZ84920.1 flagellar basal body L-ring protein FlgH [Bermanella marisrubri]